jgi:pilus assembly protein FimV
MAAGPAPEQRIPAPAPEKAVPAPAAPKSAPAASGAAKPSAAGAARQVAKGETLGKIANEVRPAGVNLDQMLAALFLGNKEAFDGGNMNRLRAGKILKIPDNEAVAAVEPSEARKMVIAQAADFNAYRKKLAAVTAAEPAKEAAPKQAVTGKITPKVEEKAPPAPAGKDKLEVSRNETSKGAQTAARVGAMEEDLVARDKALKEANSRIAALEKNLAELKRLTEMKAGAGAKPAETPAKPAEPPKPAPALTVPAKPVEPPKPAEVPKPAEAPKPAAPPAAPKPPVEPAPEPSFIAEHPEVVYGGGAIVALLLGLLGYNAWRRKRAAAEEAGATGEPASSVFGTAGGQTVDTGAALPTDFSQQPGFDTAGDEGVDPVAEADVYIAYGRDTQAEEILLEALKTDPTRTAIHVKLLEIYATRKDLASFESVARELYGLAGGAGPDWERAQLLGRSIDPLNPLYGGEASSPAPEMAATVVTTAADLQPTPQAEAAPAEEAPAEEEMPATLDFDLDLGAAPAAETTAPAEEIPVAEAPAPDEVASLDFDLGATPEAAPAAEAEASGGLDFELDSPVSEPEAPAAEAAAAATESGGLDFDFDLSEPAAEEAPAPSADIEVAALDLPTAAEAEAPAVAPEAAEPLEMEAPEPEAPTVEFDAAPEPVTPPEMPALDLAGISLDLDEPPAETPAEPSAEVPVEPPTFEPIAEPAAEPPTFEPVAETPASPAVPETTVIVDDPEVATKLELAQAYEELGDKEGARELLNEVLNEGSPAQQEAARQKLAALA